MKNINLSKNKIAIIDDDDFINVSKYKWFFHSKGYACRNERVGKKKNNCFMHRFILGAKNGEQVDHINRNKLDNRKVNLRICSNSQNQMNSKLRKDNTSRCKGVSWHKIHKKWQSKIFFNGKDYWLGYFHDKKDAIKIYKKEAMRLFGEFANFNK